MAKTEEEKIIDGLTGDLQIGKKYYFFTVIYHYIGVVKSIGEKTVTLEAESAMIVMNAGSDNESVSKIIAGKMNPEISEKPKRPIIIWQQALVTCIPF